MTDDFFTVNDLRSYYKIGSIDVKAVDGVSFKVKKGEVVGIVGESGCGKSTLGLSILRLNKPPCYIIGGEVFFKGVDLLHLDKKSIREKRLSEIAYVPQSSMNALNPVLNIEDQITDSIEAHQDIDKIRIKSTIQAQLEMMGLPRKTAKMYPHELSGGMKQRAIIAIATSLKPELLICDEPTTALDVIIQRLVLEYLKKISKEIKMSIIFITHNIAVQSEISNMLIVMYAGKIMEISNIYDIYKETLHPYTKCLIDATPILGFKKPFVSIPGTPPSLINPPLGCRFQSRCPNVHEKCKEQEPILQEIQPNRLVACHLHGDD